jgi:tetratricopeptide (TPR) repeat protein
VGWGLSGSQEFSKQSNLTWHDKKANQLNRVHAGPTSNFPYVFTLILIFLPVRMAAQTAVNDRPTSIHDSGTGISEAVSAKPPSHIITAAELRVPPKATKHLLSAQKLFQKMDTQGALREIARALEVDPNCAQAFSMRSFVDLATHDRDSALIDALHAVALDSHDAESFLALATAYNTAKLFQKAAEAAQQALRLDPGVWQARLELAKSLYSQSQYLRALNVLDQMNNDFPDVHLVRADALMQLGLVGKAAEQFDLFLKEAPNDPRSERIRGIVASVRESSSLPN